MTTGTLYAVGVLIDENDATIPAKWSVVCERCGSDLSDEYSPPRTIINIKGNTPPQQFEQFKRQWYAQVTQSADAWKTAITNFSEGIEKITLTTELQVRLEEHARKCCGKKNG